eukprot:scaffold231789_cov33-Tisochrysis_lutea.AAC.7
MAGTCGRREAEAAEHPTAASLRPSLLYPPPSPFLSLSPSLPDPSERCLGATRPRTRRRGAATTD